jgi:hypothetical protein
MRNVTITLPEELARRARVEAAKQDKSLSKFLADLLAERFDGAGARSGDSDKLGVLREFFYGPGYAGISKAWRGREALYAEREDELLRRYDASRLRGRFGGAAQTASGKGFAGGDHQEPYSGPQPAKPERVLSRRHRKARPHAKK